MQRLDIQVTWKKHLMNDTGFIVSRVGGQYSQGSKVGDIFFLPERARLFQGKQAASLLLQCYMYFCL